MRDGCSLLQLDRALRPTAGGATFQRLLVCRLATSRADPAGWPTYAAAGLSLTSAQRTHRPGRRRDRRRQLHDRHAAPTRLTGQRFFRIRGGQLYGQLRGRLSNRAPPISGMPWEAGRAVDLANGLASHQLRQGPAWPGCRGQLWRPSAVPRQCAPILLKVVDDRAAARRQHVLAKLQSGRADETMVLVTEKVSRRHCVGRKYLVTTNGVSQPKRHRDFDRPTGICLRRLRGLCRRRDPPAARSGGKLSQDAPAHAGAPVMPRRRCRYRRAHGLGSGLTWLTGRRLTEQVAPWGRPLVRLRAPQCVHIVSGIVDGPAPPLHPAHRGDRSTPNAATPALAGIATTPDFAEVLHRSDARAAGDAAAAQRTVELPAGATRPSCPSTVADKDDLPGVGSMAGRGAQRAEPASRLLGGGTRVGERLTELPLTLATDPPRRVWRTPFVAVSNSSDDAIGSTTARNQPGGLIRGVINALAYPRATTATDAPAAVAADNCDHDRRVG